MMENPKSCSKCGRPVAPGMKFCEACGAKIDAVPVCLKCGASLAPNVKFCEACGTLVALPSPAVSPGKKDTIPVAAPLPPSGEALNVQKGSSRSEPPVHETLVEAPGISSPDVPRGSAGPEPAGKSEVRSTTEPAMKVINTGAAVAPPKPQAREPAPAAKSQTHGKSAEKVIPVEVSKVAAAVDVWTSPDPGSGDAGMRKEPGEKEPAFSRTVIIGSVIILALLGAAVFFIGLPMFTGSGSPPLNPKEAPVTMNPGFPAAPSTTADTSGTGSVSLTAGPTQAPPPNLALIIDVERDAITHMITVTFQGGPGQFGVRELVVTLTKSDGTVETKTFKPENRGTFITIKGTEKTDRVEITANYYNGGSFKVVDKVFEYKKRVGSS